MIKTYKIHFKLVRSFSVGFSILSPSLNGFCIELWLGCFCAAIWSRGRNWLGFGNYWNG